MSIRIMNRSEREILNWKKASQINTKPKKSDPDE